VINSLTVSIFPWKCSAVTVNTSLDQEKYLKHASPSNKGSQKITVLYAECVCLWWRVFTLHFEEVVATMNTQDIYMYWVLIKYSCHLSVNVIITDKVSPYWVCSSHRANCNQFVHNCQNGQNKTWIKLSWSVCLAAWISSITKFTVDYNRKTTHGLKQNKTQFVSFWS
jgi:hypothetical protein